MNDELLNKILDLVRAEFREATSRFGPYASSHEGYAVILEELDELWDEIKDNKNPGTLLRQTQEAIQVATTAIRFVYDVVGSEVDE